MDPVEEHDGEPGGGSKPAALLDSWPGAAGVLVLVVAAILVLRTQAPRKALCPPSPSKARADVIAITAAAEEFAHRNGGRPPSDLETLVRPDENGASYLDCEEVPLDPWGAPYRYELVAEPPGFRVTSFGADGLPGGSGDDADVSGRTDHVGPR